jgi:uncharacterized protein YndB with AHSA1/START domain
MSRIVGAIEIDAPIAQVFDYATTAGNWPTWHSASRAVSGAVDRLAPPGARIAEEIHSSGRDWRAVWTVRTSEPPRLWVIEGKAAGGGSAALTYRLTAVAAGTRFERELVYRMPNLWLALLDRLVIRRCMAAESAQALRQLKQVLEAQARLRRPI